MNLKELTWENHKNAERKEFASLLMSGNISPELYFKYLSNQFLMYSVLEQKVDLDGLGISGIRRAPSILEDMSELQRDHKLMYEENNHACSVTKDYIQYVATKTSEQLVPHIYVRHFGDMYGGAMIKKKVPGSGKMYEFENKEELKEKTRAILNDDMADEANKCFKFAIRLFEELLPNDTK